MKIKNNKDMIKIIIIWSINILLHQFIFFVLSNNPLRNPEMIFFNIYGIFITLVILMLMFGILLTHLVLNN